MRVQELPNVIQSFSCSLQQFNIGGKYVNHPLPDMDACRPASRVDPFSVTARIVEKDFVLADMKKHGRESSYVAIKRR